MASRIQSFVLPLLLICSFIMLTERTVDGRYFPGSMKYADRKYPAWLVAGDGAMYIPGIGRITIPPFYSGNLGGGSTFGNYIPGLDDTFIPNTGFEVPYPDRTAVTSTNLSP